MNKSQYQAAFDLIKDEKNWCQGNYGLFANGTTAATFECKDAVQVCSIGACYKANGEGGYELRNFCYEKTGQTLAEYNDSHTHAEVCQMWQDFLNTLPEDGV